MKLNRPSLWTAGKLLLALTAVAALPSAGAGGFSELAVPPIALDSIWRQGRGMMSISSGATAGHVQWHKASALSESETYGGLTYYYPPTP